MPCRNKKAPQQMIDIDSIPLSFGKYINQTPEQVAERDPQYILWMYDNIKPKPCTKQLRDYCEMDIRDEEEIIKENRWSIY